jgi:hypothetical protein
MTENLNLYVKNCFRVIKKNIEHKGQSRSRSRIASLLR